MKKTLLIIFIGCCFLANSQVHFSTSSQNSFQLRTKKLGVFYVTNIQQNENGAKSEKCIINGKLIDCNLISKCKSGDCNALEEYLIKNEVLKANQKSIKQDDNLNKEINKNQIYIKASTSKTKIYQGEQILVTYKLYTRVDLAETEIHTLPALNGFWTKDLETSSRYKQTNINGIAYYVATIKKVVLTAQKSGELVIDPLKIKCQIRVQKQSNRRDPFSSFFNQYSLKEKLVSSNPINIEVQELPTPSQNNFNGAVGNMKITASIDKNNIKANEALTYKIQLEGTGNIELIDKINIEFPDDFEVYDPKINEKIFEGGRKRSKKTFEYLLIPRYKGEYTIPPVNFSFFNPVNSTYNTTRTQSFQLRIAKGENNGENLTFNSLSQQSINQINTDIKFIKTKLSKSSNHTYIKSYIFYLLFLLPIVILIILFITNKIRSQINYNDKGWRNKKAKKIAQKRLRNAETNMNNNNAEKFYEDIEKSIWGYFADKFNIQTIDLSKENIHKYFRSNNISTDIENDLISLLDNCDLLRFSPSENKHNEMEDVLKKAKQIIITMESKI